MYRMALNKHLSRTMSAYLIHSSDADFPVSHPMWTFGPVTSQSPGISGTPARRGAQGTGLHLGFAATIGSNATVQEHGAQPQQSVGAAEPSWGRAFESAGP